METTAYEKSVEIKELWGESVELAVIQQGFFGRKHPYLQLKSAAPIRLTSGEANAFLKATKESLATDLPALGISVENEAPKSELERDAEFLRNQLPTEQCLVLLDTTTINNALDCLHGNLNAANLLDLAIVAFAVVCFDRIIIQQNYILEKAITPLSDSFFFLKYPLEIGEKYSKRFISGPLVKIGIPDTLNTGNRQRAEADTFERIWSKYLGVRQTDIHLNLNYNVFQQSPDFWDGIPASYYIPLRRTLGNKVDEQMNEFLSVQTIRTLFNDGFAGFVGVPYIGTSIRAGVHAVLLRRKLETQLIADKLLSHIGPRPLRHRTSTYVAESSAPFILGLILEKIGSRENFWTALADYRARFQPLRERLRADRREWDGKSGQYVRRLTRHLGGLSREANDLGGEALKTGAVGATTIATGSKEAGELAGLAVKLLMLLKPAEVAYHVYLKYFRPELHLLFDLSKEAQLLRSVENRINALWGPHSGWGREDRDELEFMASVHPGAFLKLRTLE